MCVHELTADKTNHDVLTLSFPTRRSSDLIIFRPGMLKRPNSDRGLERLSVSVLQFFNRLGLLKKQSPLPTPLLAQKISVAPLKLGSGVSKINLNEIFSF